MGVEPLSIATTAGATQGCKHRKAQSGEQDPSSACEGLCTGIYCGSDNRPQGTHAPAAPCCIDQTQHSCGRAAVLVLVSTTVQNHSRIFWAACHTGFRGQHEQHQGQVWAWAHVDKRCPSASIKLLVRPTHPTMASRALFASCQGIG